jgi:hypothetical protein
VTAWHRRIAVRCLVVRSWPPVRSSRAQLRRNPTPPTARTVPYTRRNQWIVECSLMRYTRRSVVSQ